MMERSMDVSPTSSAGVNDDSSSALVLRLWASTVGLRGEVELLVAARRELTAVLSEAQGKEIQNKALVLHLRETWHNAFRTDDLLSALEYYRIWGEDGGDGDGDDDKLVFDNDDQNLLLATHGNVRSIHKADEGSSSSTEDSSSGALQVVPYIASTRLVPHLEVTVKDVSCEISEHAEECRRMINDVRNALELEKLDSHMLDIYQSTWTDPREMSSFTTVRKVYGRDQERDSIVSMLTSEESTRKDLSVLAIVGNGGVGKTTLAQVVYKDPSVLEHFDMVLWHYVSVHFNQVKSTRELLEFLHGNRYEDITDFKGLQNILGHEMKSKRVLLVMDDMWEDSKMEKWDEFVAPLITNGVKGNMIIVTTRKPSVARMTGAAHIKLDGLQDEDFWHLFKECAFGDENHHKHQKLQRIGRKIVDKLKGYPLAAKTVGKLLSRKLDVEHWNRILENSEWKEQSGDHDIIPALKISYNYLPTQLQQCFSYCSVFPKDHRYDEQRLVNIWIAQGFIPFTDQYTHAEEIGRKYIVDLIDWGFFLSEPPRPSLLMHDLVHDLAQIVSSHESFTIVDFKPTDDLKLIRHVSVITESAYYGLFDGTIQLNDEDFMQEFAKTFFILPKKNLSTLMLFGAHDLSFADIFRHGLNEVKAVRVINMEMVYPDIDILIPSLSKFINLRYLELRPFYRGLKLQLPEAICKLYQLQVLDIKYFNATTILPKGMNKLGNLRHFFAREELHAQIASVGRLIFLQELMAFDVRKERGFSIVELEKLDGIRGSISIYNLQNLESQEEASKARLYAKLYLTILRLSWSDMPNFLSSLNIIEGLEPPKCIEKLQIDGYKGSAPLWLNSSSCLTSLKSLHLEKCIYWCTLPPLQLVPLLRELHLIDMPHVKSIPLGRLKVLELRNMPRLRQFIEIERDQPHEELEVLELQGFYHLRDLPFQLCSSGMLTEYLFPRLRRVQIRDCHGYTNLPPFPLVDTSTDIDIWNTSSQYYMSFQLSLINGSRLRLEMEGHKGNHLQALDETVLRFSQLKDLQELEIRCYPYVKCLAWEGLQQMASLKRFKMSDFANLFSNSPKLCLPISVKEIEFDGCDITGKQLSNIMLNLASLQKVKVQYCEKITSLAVGMFSDDHIPSEDGLWHIPPSRLVTLELLEINSSDMFFWGKNGLGGFNRLKEINTRKCPMLFSSMISEVASEVPNFSLLPQSLLKLSIGDVVDRLLPGSKLSSLVELHIGRSPLLKSLDLSSCPALQQLEIEDCDMLESIKGLQITTCLAKMKIISCRKLASVQLHACTSLQILIIEQCDALRRLDGTHPLTSLKQVNIYKNPVLESVEMHSCCALEELSIRECPALASWQSFRSLTGIRYLKVFKSPGFVPCWQSAAEQIKKEGVEFSIPLKDLDIDDIEFLSMPICEQLTSLEDLTIHGVNHTWSDKVDILMDNHEAALLLLTSLKRLTLSGFRHLESLPSKIHSLPLLKVLNIWNCPGITTLPEEGMPPSLAEMALYRCSNELIDLCRSMNPKERRFRIFINNNMEL